MTEWKTEFDAAVVGGGVIGCGIAWRLAQAGVRVVVLERGEPGRESSWAAGGMLVPLAETNQADEFFTLTRASLAQYAGFARELREATGIDIEYRAEGTLHLAFTDDDEAELERRWQWQHDAGLNVKRLNRDCVLKLEPSFAPALRWALKFPDDHQIDNRRLAKALELAALGAGATILSHTQVTGLLTAGDAVVGARTTRGEIRARTVILAAGAWSSQIDADAGVRVGPVRGQMVAMEMPAPPIRHLVYSCRAYLVPRNGGFVIAGSTTEEVGFDKRVTTGGIASILERAVEIAPALAQSAILETWAGLRPRLDLRTPHPEWPVLGADPRRQGLVFATGHYRNGILLAPITASAIAELVLRGETSVDLRPFGPERCAQARSA